jgi:transcriptional regulatory protein GAL4
MSVYSALIWQSSFCVTTNRIYNRVIGAPPPPFEELIVMDHEIQHWHSTVPEWMTASATPRMFDDTPWLYFSAHKLFWRYSNLRIILARRAFLERALKALPMGPSSPPEGMDLEHTLATICLQCAIDTIYDIHGFFKGRTLGRLDAWYGLHFLFQATFVPLIALHTDITSPDKSTWQEAVRVACETMRFVQGDALADRCLRSIDLLKPTVSEEISHAEVNSSGLLDFFQANPMWNGSAGIDL